MRMRLMVVMVLVEGLFGLISKVSMLIMGIAWFVGIAWFGGIALLVWIQVVVLH